MENIQISQFYRDYLMPAVPRETVLRLIRASGNENLRARDLLPYFRQNSAYWHMLLKLNFLQSKIAAWKAEVPEVVDHSEVITLRVLTLYGKELIRDIVVCFAMNRAMGTGLPRGVSDSLEISSTDQIPFALQTQQYLQEKKWMHSDMGYNAGLHYDWVTALMNKKQAPGEVMDYLKECYSEGLLIAQMAYRFGQKLGLLQLDRYVFGSGLLIPLGRALSAVFIPPDHPKGPYLQFLEKNKTHPRGAREALHLLEKGTYGVTHNELLSLFASSFLLYRPAEKALLTYQEPFLLKSVDRGSFTLAMVLSIAILMADAISTNHVGDLTYTTSQRRWFQQIKLREEVINRLLDEYREELAEGQSDGQSKG